MSEVERIGVDFDGTLVEWTEGYVPDKIGPSIPDMVDRVKKWLRQGHEVVIFTARVHPKHEDEEEIARKAIRRWCQGTFGVILEVTCMKDYRMTKIYDDIAISVEQNTGRILTEGVAEEDEKEDADALGSLLLG